MYAPRPAHATTQCSLTNPKYSYRWLQGIAEEYVGCLAGPDHTHYIRMLYEARTLHGRFKRALWQEIPA